MLPVSAHFGVGVSSWHLPWRCIKGVDQSKTRPVKLSSAPAQIQS